VPIQLPIGNEEKFRGIVDLITMKAIVYHAEDLGAESETIDIPADMVEAARAHREKMVEIVAEMDDELTHKYLEGHTLSPEDIKRGLRLGTSNIASCRSWRLRSQEQGRPAVLDAVVDFLPSPLDVPPIIGEHPVTHKEVLRTANDSEPFSALVFKIAADPYVGKLAYFRVYSARSTPGRTF